MKLSQLLATALLLAGSSLAHAQYMWIDEKGLKQLSDRPPPPSVPLKNILKQPGGIANQLVPVDAPAPAAPPPAAQPKPAALDPNAEFKKRVREQQEKDEKARKDEETKLAKKTYCESVKRNKQMLESGARMGTVEQNGERGHMSDEQRAKELERANQALAGCE